MYFGCYWRLGERWERCWGRVLIVSSADGLLLRCEPDGSLVTHVELGGRLKRHRRRRTRQRLRQHCGFCSQARVSVVCP